jgi:hypothetical protein
MPIMAAEVLPHTMPFRIRFSWGLPLSVLGFAALAAAAGWLLLTDYHGHLALRCAVHAVGGALLGVAGWRASERLTDYVNLHTSAFLRLALPGAGATWAATEVAGVFTELTAGGGAWWAEAAAPLLFFAVGVVPLLAGIALLAGFETLLAAQRGGGGALQAVRPIAVHMLAAVLALSGVGYVVVMVPDAPIRGAMALAPERVRASGWTQRERGLFTEVHAGWSCAVLVVPIAGAAPSLDRAARSLITRLLAAQLAQRSGLCVTDPTLVARALGAHDRTSSQRAVRKLADAVNARHLVQGEVRVDAERPAFHVALRMYTRAHAQAPWDGGGENVWGPLPYSDELPPEAAFARVAREAAEGLGLPLTAESEPPESEESEKLPGAIGQLAGHGATALARARALQLLAAAHHASDLNGEHLWERSIVALSALPAAHDAARVLRARAALHLQRRPYALQLLDGVGGSEAAAVRALADGNLLDAERRRAELADVAALTLDLELAALRARYAKDKANSERRKFLLDSWPGYAALLYVPLSPAEAAAGDAHTVIAGQLAALGADAPPPRIESLAARLGVDLPGRGAGLALAADLERGRASFWRSQASAWRSERGFDRVAAWDIPDALYAANRAAVVLRLRALAAGPDSGAALEEDLRALGASFGGYGGIQTARAVALRRLGAGGGERAFLMAERSRRLQTDVLAWEGGESDTERELRARLQTEQPPQPDEPPRPWRGAPAGESETGSSALVEALHFARMQSFAQDDFEVLQRAIQLYERAGQPDRVAQLMHLARTRFVGSPVRERFLLQRAEAARDLATAVGLLQERIREQPEQWAAYPLLARAYLRAREPAMAQRALLNYPAFNGAGGHGAVRHAVESGALLLAAGEGEFARPLLELAAQAAQDGEPSPRLEARMALAQLDGNWIEARTLALALHEQHGAEHALARAGTLAFLLGEREAGWRAFYEASKRFESLAPWSAAIDGHRLEATKPDEVVAFAKRWKSLSGERGRETRLKQQFLFNVFLVDRPAADWAVEALTDFAQEREDPAFAALVRGYTAFKRGQYPEVVGELEPLQQGAREPETLPWLALALHKTGRGPDAEALVQAAGKQPATAFYAALGLAYVAGAKGEHERALGALWDAFLSAPGHLDTAVPAAYQVLEACERLLALSADDRYRQLLLDLARRQQRAWPVSWAFAFEARHATHPDDVERALGAALYLDAESERLRHIAPAQRQRALDRFSRANPFRRA